MENTFYFCADTTAVDSDWRLPIGKLIETVRGASHPEPDHYAVLDQIAVEKAFLPELNLLLKKFGPDLPLAEISRREMESLKAADERGGNLLQIIVGSVLPKFSEPGELHDIARVADLYKGIVQLHRIGNACRPCPFVFSDDYFLNYCKLIHKIRRTGKVDGRIRKNQKRTLAPQEYFSAGDRIESDYQFDARFNFPVELDPAPWIAFWQ